MDNKKYLDVIDQNASLFTDVSDKIWEYAELSLMEFQSAELYCKVLKDAGFEVETPVAGIKTAFKAIYGMMLCPVFLRSAELPSARNWFQTAVVMAAVTICWVQALWQLLLLSKNIWKTVIPEPLSSMVVLVKKAVQPKHLWHVTASGKNWTLLSPGIQAVLIRLLREPATPAFK